MGSHMRLVHPTVVDIKGKAKRAFSLCTCEVSLTAERHQVFQSLDRDLCRMCFGCVAAKLIGRLEIQGAAEWACPNPPVLLDHVAGPVFALLKILAGHGTMRLEANVWAQISIHVLSE